MVRTLLFLLLASAVAGAEECRFPNIATVTFELPEGYVLRSSPQAGSENQQWTWAKGKETIHLSMLAWKKVDTPLAKLSTNAYFEDHYKKAGTYKHVSGLKRLPAKQVATLGAQYGMRSISNASWAKGPQLSLYTDRCMIVFQTSGAQDRTVMDALLGKVRVAKG